MQLVKFFTRVLEFTAQQKLARAQKRSDKAAKTFQKARRSMTVTNQELQMTQAELLIQLNKINSVNDTVMQSRRINERKMAALDAFMADVTNDSDVTLESEVKVG